MTSAERALVVALARTVDTLAAIVVALVPPTRDQDVYETNKATFRQLAMELRRIIDGLEREG